MKYFTIAAISLFLFASTVKAEMKPATDYFSVATLADSKAQFPGGKEKMTMWIKQNLMYPEDNFRYGIVRIEFTVKKNGKLSDFVIAKSVNETMDLAALNCLMGMPKWEPATVNGEKVNSKVTLPIKFENKEDE